MAGKGGARPGAGRKKNAVKLADKIAGFTERVADGLGEREAKLRMLADGGWERLEFKEQISGTLTRKGIAWQPRRDDDGSIVCEPGTGEPILDPITDAKGNPVIVEVPIFPDLAPDYLVVVERKRFVMAPDFRANEYLVDRVMGKPRQAVEMTGEDGDAIRHAVTIYLPDNGRDARDAADPTAARPPGGVA